MLNLGLQFFYFSNFNDSFLIERKLVPKGALEKTGRTKKSPQYT